MRILLIVLLTSAIIITSPVETHAGCGSLFGTFNVSDMRLGIYDYEGNLVAENYEGLRDTCPDYTRDPNVIGYIDGEPVLNLPSNASNDPYRMMKNNEFVGIELTPEELAMISKTSDGTRYHEYSHKNDLYISVNKAQNGNRFEARIEVISTNLSSGFTTNTSFHFSDLVNEQKAKLTHINESFFDEKVNFTRYLGIYMSTLFFLVDIQYEKYFYQTDQTAHIVRTPFLVKYHTRSQNFSSQQILLSDEANNTVSQRPINELFSYIFKPRAFSNDVVFTTINGATTEGLFHLNVINESFAKLDFFDDYSNYGQTPHGSANIVEYFSGSQHNIYNTMSGLNRTIDLPNTDIQILSDDYIYTYNWIQIGVTEISSGDFEQPSPSIWDTLGSLFIQSIPIIIVGIVVFVIRRVRKQSIE